MAERTDDEFLEAMINRPLSPGCRYVLQQMSDNEDSEDGELVASGIQVWLGDSRVSYRVLHSLLQHVAISQDQYSDSACRRFHINETGKKLLCGEVVKVG